MDKERLGKLLKIDDKRAEAKKIEGEMSRPDYWNDRENAAKMSQRLSDINLQIEKFDKASSDGELADLEKETLYDGEYDAKNAILSVHAGAGGTEAQDWAEMLLSMFLKYVETHQMKATLLEKSAGDEAGVKSAAIRIEGSNVYGNLKGEAGVHRLVRISPFDADKARHTSFALVEIIPEFEDLGDIELGEKEVRIDVFRSSGHGGQSVNTTDSAVRITHLPTKISVSVQNERSQLQNRETAIKILKSKLKKKMLDERSKKENEIKGGHISAEWGNQIRSYVLQPYRQVKDHRTGYEETNPDSVLGGGLDGFIENYLRKLKK